VLAASPSPGDTSDCEVRDDWFLEQDVNAWTSLAYVAVGALLLVAVVRRRVSPAFAALAAVVVAEGVGSWLYHGGTGDVAQFMHDVALVGALGFVAGWHVGRLAGGTDRMALVGLAAGVVGGGAVWLVAPGATNVVVAVLVATTVVAEIAARRRGAPAVFTVPLLVLGAVAVAMWWAGTPDSPACDEQSWVQPHGGWHIVTSVLVLAWVDRASTVDDFRHAPRLFRRGTDLALGSVVRMLVHAFHRSVETFGRQRVPRDRPMLVVANHGNGFVDPLVVTAALGRLPRFIAKAALWRVVLARPFLDAAGVLPVHRRADGDRPGDNVKMFAACHEELARGGTIAIFPEGTTGDRAGLDRVRTGAARIALGAVDGAPDLAIVPVGLAFESTIETRSRALVVVGEPLAAADFARHPPGPDGEPDRDDVARLTDAIREALEDVSPEFDTVYEREVLRASAGVDRTVARQHGETRFGEVEVVARRMAAAPPEVRARVVEAFRRYATGLQLIGLTDRELSARPGPIRRLVLSAAVLLLFGSFVVAATLVYLPALVLVVVATGLVRSTATKGTVRMLVGLAAGLATWIVAGIVLADGAAAWLAGALVAVGGWLALVVWAPLTRELGGLWARVRVRDRAGLLPPVLVERELLVAAVRDAVAATTDGSERRVSERSTAS
jgi:glycerol-3-phosphate O-acyltransferase / dihydroxyacetone phosphate acyltransferase